jgi:hypothetical protein
VADNPLGGRTLDAVLDKAIVAFKETVVPALRIIRFLLLIMLPVSFAVLLLKTSGILYYISAALNPLMKFLGLPGEAALAFLTSVVMNIYSAIAVIETLTLSGKQMIILATMCLIAHNFFVEILVMKRTGSMIIKIVFLRLVSAVAAAWVLRRIVPENAGKAVASAGALMHKTRISLSFAEIAAQLPPWLTSSLVLILQVSLIIFAIMFLQRLLTEFGLMKRLAALMSPVMGFFGLPAKTGYVWIVAYTVGVAYGSGILIEEVKEGNLSKSEADLLNHHIALSHSQIEDTLLFVYLGVPYLWAALPRFLLALISVWVEKFRRAVFRRGFRVKVV